MLSRAPRKTVRDLSPTGVRRHCERIAERGYSVPIDVLSPAQCRRFLRAVDDRRRAPPLDWDKGCAATSRAFYELAMHPAIIGIVSTVLKEGVMLWGASIQERRPGEAHPWHSDIESVQSRRRTVSVWIGLANTGRESSLSVVARSHRFGSSVQEARSRAGVRRADTTSAMIGRWARAHDPGSRVVETELHDGQALVFDGRLWHGSRNRSRLARRALLLQYATPDTPIRMPDLNQLDWPFRTIESPLPPCVMLRGDDTARVNRVVPAPVAASTIRDPRLTSRIYPLRLPLAPDEKRPWKPYPIFRGAISNVGSLSCHVSTLRERKTPHRPHIHDEEELLLMLSGEADLRLEPGAAGRRSRLKAGEFVYYPRHFRHSLRAEGRQAANYLMFKWRSRATTAQSGLAHGRYRFSGGRRHEPAKGGFTPRLVFEGPTHWLRKLHCHVSTLAPGGGYDAHIDAHDVALIVLEGEVETLGHRVQPHGVVFYAAGEPHGIRNPGARAARYVVFEFHGG
jgi:quercetin dioxygenase-like cupin family protein